MKLNKLLILIKRYINNTSKNVLIYVFTSVLTGGVSIFLTTFLVNHLSQNDYGQLEAFLSVSSLLTSLIMFGGSTFVIHYYSSSSLKNEYEYSISLVFFNTLLLFIIGFPLLIIMEDNFVFFGVLALFYSSLNAVYNIILTSYQLESKASNYAKVNVLFSLVSVFLTIVIQHYFNHYFSRVFSLILVILILLTFMGKPFIIAKIKNNIFMLGNLIKGYKVGLPLAIGQVSSWVLEKFDRLIIISLLGPSLLAVYGLGYQFGMLMLLFQSAISKAWVPYLQKKIELNDRRTIKSTIRKISFVYFLAVFLISFSGYIYINYFIDRSYNGSIYIVPFVTMGYAFDGVWKLYNSILIVEKNYKLYTKQVIIIGILNMCLTYIFVNTFGILGAAFSTLLSFFIGFAWNYIYLSYNVNWFEKLEN
jgi:O-antigen/teichoic acid export membrane protein